MCYITYPYKDRPPSSTIGYVRSAIKNKRMEFVADTVAMYAIWEMHEAGYLPSSEQLVLMGFSLGSNIAKYIC